MNNSFNRRDFLRLLTLLGFGTLSACSNKDNILPPTSIPTKPKPTSLKEKINSSATTTPTSPIQATPTKKIERTTEPTQSSNDGRTYLAVTHGTDPAAITKAAIAALGGIERFVKSGADVIIKPNICTDYYPAEYAATTNPAVVAAIVSLCLGAGAKRVRVMDHPFGGSSESAYKRSGIADAVAAAGGQMEIMNQNKYQKTVIPDGRDLKEWTFYQDIIKADVVINIPIAKTHGIARLTLGGKNMLGVIQRPNMMHANIGQRVADLVSLIRPSLTIIDAVRILMRNGPTGGNLDDVKITNTIIASQDIVAADSYATTLFGMQGSDISYIQAAAQMGLGTMNLQSIKIEEINI